MLQKNLLDISRRRKKIAVWRSSMYVVRYSGSGTGIESGHFHDAHVRDVYYPPDHIRKFAHVSSTEQYQQLYRRSMEDPEGFWGDIAGDFLWHKKWDAISNSNFNTPSIKYFEGGKWNITENCLDRHVDAGFGERPALTWEADDGSSITYTFASVLNQVCTIAKVLEAQGVKRGDRVSIYMPMVPDLAFAMLACARMGAVHSVIFGGFSAEAVASRIVDSDSGVVITTDAGLRGGRVVPLKPIVDAACTIAAGKGVNVRRVLVSHRAGPGTGPGVPGWMVGRDMSLEQAMEEVVRNSKARGEQKVDFTPASMGSEDPLFLMYTSGSTGKPKGVMHTTAGYAVYAATTHKYVFDTRPSAADPAKRPHGAPGPDLHFCTADCGWITGHSYIVYGPFLNGTHTLMFEGVPTYPGPDRLWSIVEKHKATTLYTAPTAIRALMVYGEEPLKKYDLSSLRILGSVGEPINSEAWLWLHKAVGKGRLPIVDTYWQTETGGHILTSLPGGTNGKPGMATKPFFGIDAKVVRPDGTECNAGEGGYLVIDKPWPGMLRGVHGDAGRFKEAYFSQMPGRYFTGDGAVRDKDGDFQILGRVDDVINVSGHRLGTAEVEAALALHPSVVESAVVGYPHPVKGEGIWAYVILRREAAWNEATRKELVSTVRKAIGPIASPDVIHVTLDLPKTRSGKIMRRILRKVAAGEKDQKELGDISTLADPHVVGTLIATRDAALESSASGSKPRA